MYKSFEDAEKEYYGFWYSEKNNKSKAIEIAEYCLENYSEHKKQIIMDLIIFYGETKNAEKCSQMLNMAFKDNTWYPKEFFEKFWDDSSYKKERIIWNALKKKSLEDADVFYEVDLPNNYDDKKEYPLFISLHGWGEDLELFKMFWKSNKIKKDYIHVFIQSSQIVGSYHYAWSDQDIARKDLIKVISTVRDKYATSTKTIIGGFSEGATTSINFAFNLKELNASGFIALNPDRPSSLTTKNINKLEKNDIRGAIITGDMDSCFKSQKDMIEEFKANNIPCKFHINENFGHWFPDDLPQLIDEAITFIDLSN